MPAEELSDDYVANLLKNDAKVHANRYAAVGLQAFMPTRRSTNAPKPNTRFLRNIIRDTDNHNAALLAKETEESRARLRALQRKHEESDGAPNRRSRNHPHGEDKRDRSHKRRRVEESEVRRKGRRSRRDASCDKNARGRSPSSGDEYARRHRRRKDDSYKDGHRREYKHRSRRDRERRHEERSHRHRSDSDDEQKCRRSESRHRRRRRTSHSRAWSRSQSRSPEGSRTRRSTRESRPQSSPQRSSRHSHNNTLARSPSPSSDSDPLDEIVGPMPPSLSTQTVRSRGRGIYSAPAIDSHFSSTYDPSNDVQAAQEQLHEGSDWDQALEVLRDRERWRAHGAERLRAAGFSDADIKKWERSGKGKGEEDVVWRKKGEGREWDRGKVVDEDGVSLRAEWAKDLDFGRLKGT
ncbi:hypothetical protein BDY21DRAFT_335372 [Lineolata rhizophorae]|uniref:Pre-mRNA-splicing factor 38B n=1 Tax=Lineolata rhizophorae TaxID=578093 RepID=A0A6A6P9F2_9PEZI|nr:hypothetical protein BDY21DRAFT_335372 [Lineolata rhizophorae]